MSSSEDGSTAKRQRLMPPASTSREAQPDTEESTTSDETFSPVLEHYLVKTFDWKVSGCSQMVSPDKGDEAEKTYYRRSPSFRFMGHTWYLHLYPNLPNMVVCLMLSGEGSGPPVRLHHSFGVRNVEGDVDWKIHAIGNFGAGTQNVWKNNNCFLSKEELVEKKRELVLDDAITVVCKLSSEKCSRFLRDQVCTHAIFDNIVGKKRQHESKDPFYSIRKRLGVIHSETLKIKCQLKSPLFAPCLLPGGQRDMKCDVLVFAMLVVYLDAGKVSMLSIEKTLELYELAITYEVVGLRERCLACVTAWLEPETVIKVLDFAKKHSLTELLEVATKYLVSHAMQVVATSQWMRLVREDPEWANHFYRRIAERVSTAVCP